MKLIGLCHIIHIHVDLQRKKFEASMSPNLLGTKHCRNDENKGEKREYRDPDNDHKAKCSVSLY